MKRRVPHTIRNSRLAVPIVLVVALMVAFAGCASVDFDYPKPETHALLDTAETNLGRTFAQRVARHPGESGFRLLTDGIDAMAARLLIARQAERSIDVQYYLITNDLIGLTFIAFLLEAADRGVRVRMLLDDIQTQGYDAGFAGLDSHPNFEVRVFNPFAGRDTRIADGIGDFGRVNRRMHNKSFTADNQITVIGGRNIAAEYFAAREDVNFGDVDALGIGPVVQDVSTMFDSYWNHDAAVPVPAFAKMPEDPAQALLALRERLGEAVAKIHGTRYADAVREDYDAYMESAPTRFTWAPSTLAYDSPDKAVQDRADEAESILVPLDEAIQQAKSQLVVMSPYFVPQRSGIEYLIDLHERGVEVVVITNSLAATNHSIVHSGYAPARRPLLEKGIRIFEVRPDAAVSGVARGGHGASLATLHTKLFVIDRQKIFIGSFNWDPRSALLNTELGVIIDSPVIGEDVVRRIEAAYDRSTYEVVLDEKGRMRWIDRSGAEPIALTSEPQSSVWRRLGANLMRLLPIKGQL